MGYSWHCPFCNHNATIELGKNSGSNRYEFGYENKYGYQVVRTYVVVCPNPECREYTLTVSLHDHVQAGTEWKDKEAKKIWNLIPQAEIKIFPAYVPRPIIDDYEEACLVRGSVS